ncbi:MAG: anti-sigma factor [Vicinamibacterales bacterium]
MKDYRCDDKEGLVAYLYDELGAEQHRAVEAHLAVCSLCTGEVQALAGVRQELGAWLAPESHLGVAITQPPAPVLRPVRWRAAAIPGWAQAAAAVLVVAAGAAIANVQVRYDASGVTMSTGWTPVVAPTATGTIRQAADPTSSPDAEWRSELASLEAEMRQEIQALRPAQIPTGGAVSSASTSETALLRRVQSLIDASERRQQQELALRLTQFGRDVEVQRRADLVRIEQGVGQLQGRTGAEVARQREVLNYLVRVSGRQVVPE